MNFEKIYEVLSICVPVFCVIAFGKVLSKTGFMQKSDGNFLTKLTYNFALPALIFSALAKQDSTHFFQSSLIITTLLPILITAILFIILSALLPLRGKKAAVFVYSSFWGNTVYIGFPLCTSAFGYDQGLTNAALINAVCTPAYISLSLFTILWFQCIQVENPWKHLIKSFRNPLIISIVAGILTSYLKTSLQHLPHHNLLITMLHPIRTVLDEFLRLIGAMGLALSLIAMGGHLTTSSFKQNKLVLILSIIGKLIILPLSTLLIINIFYPTMTQQLRGVLVLLAAMPEAVAAFVISKQLQIDEDFVASHLILSTLASVITIPVWLYLL